MATPRALHRHGLLRHARPRLHHRGTVPLAGPMPQGQPLSVTGFPRAAVVLRRYRWGVRWSAPHIEVPARLGETEAFSIRTAGDTIRQIGADNYSVLHQSDDDSHLRRDEWHYRNRDCGHRVLAFQLLTREYALEPPKALRVLAQGRLPQNDEACAIKLQRFMSFYEKRLRINKPQVGRLIRSNLELLQHDTRDAFVAFIDHLFNTVKVNGKFRRQTILRVNNYTGQGIADVVDPAVDFFRKLLSTKAEVDSAIIRCPNIVLASAATELRAHERFHREVARLTRAEMAATTLVLPHQWTLDVTKDLMARFQFLREHLHMSHKTAKESVLEFPLWYMMHPDIEQRLMLHAAYLAEGFKIPHEEIGPLLHNFFAMGREQLGITELAPRDLRLVEANVRDFATGNQEKISRAMQRPVKSGWIDRLPKVPLWMRMKLRTGKSSYVRNPFKS